MTQSGVSGTRIKARIPKSKIVKETDKWRQSGPCARSFLRNRRRTTEGNVLRLLFLKSLSHRLSVSERLQKWRRRGWRGGCFWWMLIAWPELLRSPWLLLDQEPSNKRNQGRAAELIESPLALLPRVWNKLSSGPGRETNSRIGAARDFFSNRKSH